MHSSSRSAQRIIGVAYCCGIFMLGIATSFIIALISSSFWLTVKLTPLVGFFCVIWAIHVWHRTQLPTHRETRDTSSL